MLAGRMRTARVTCGNPRARYMRERSAGIYTCAGFAGASPRLAGRTRERKVQSLSSSYKRQVDPYP